MTKLEKFKEYIKGKHAAVVGIGVSNTPLIGFLLDFVAEEGAFEISTETDDLNAVREALEAKGYAIASADTDKVPSSYVTLTGEDDIKNMGKLIEALEDNDDVIEVYHNWENPDEE